MSKYDLITREVLLDIFSYVQGSGEIRWKDNRKRGVKAGDLVGSNKCGYKQTTILGHCFRIHKLVWFLEYGVFPQGHIDHIDGNRSNNHPSNLREVTQQENNHNQRTAKGYYFDKRTQKYKAQIKVDGKVISLGSYLIEQDARNAYLSAKKIYHPTFIPQKQS